MSNRKTLWITALTLTICGCGHRLREDRVTYHNVGHLVSASEHPRGFFDIVTSKVTTDRGAFIVNGDVTVVLPGEPVRVSSDGLLCIPGNRPLRLWGWWRE